MKLGLAVAGSTQGSIHPEMPQAPGTQGSLVVTIPQGAIRAAKPSAQRYYVDEPTGSDTAISLGPGWWFSGNEELMKQIERNKPMLALLRRWMLTMDKREDPEFPQQEAQFQANRVQFRTFD